MAIEAAEVAEVGEEVVVASTPEAEVGVGVGVATEFATIS